MLGIDQLKEPQPDSALLHASNTMTRFILTTRPTWNIGRRPSRSQNTDGVRMTQPARVNRRGLRLQQQSVATRRRFNPTPVDGPDFRPLQRRSRLATGWPRSETARNRAVSINHTMKS